MKNLVSIEINAVGGGNESVFFEEYCAYSNGSFVPGAYFGVKIDCIALDNETNSCWLGEEAHDIKCDDNQTYYATNGTHYSRNVDNRLCFISINDNISS